MKKTIIDLFEASVRKYGAKTFLLEKRHHKFEPTTYAETREQALEAGAGLAALGIRPGDKVAILAEGSNAWIISELGLFYAGAVSVPLSVKLEESNDLLFRMRHAEVKAVFVSKHQLPKIRRIRAGLPQLEQVIVLGHIPLESGETAYGTLKRLGREYLAKNKAEFMEIGQAIRNDDYATITYTSGTTSDPKGVILTHRNYTANVEQALSRVDIPPHFRTLIILPLDHCFAHVVGFYIMIACGASVATVQIGATPMETLKNIPQNIREVQPHFLLSVPALAKNFRKNIESSIRAKGRLTEALFNLALRTAYAYNSDGYGRGSGWRIVLAPVVGIFDALLFRKVRQAFGGHLEFFVGGAARRGVAAVFLRHRNPDVPGIRTFGGDARDFDQLAQTSLAPVRIVGQDTHSAGPEDPRRGGPRGSPRAEGRNRRPRRERHGRLLEESRGHGRNRARRVAPHGRHGLRLGG